MTDIEIKTMLRMFDRPIAFHRVLVDLTGSINAALMLSQALYWTPRGSSGDGWFYKTAEEWEQETGMTVEEQRHARKKLKETTFWHESLKRVPATLHFRIDLTALYEALQSVAGKPQNQFGVDPNLVSGKPQNQFVGNPETSLGQTPNQFVGNPETITENTSETTTENTHRVVIAPDGAEQQTYFKSLKEEVLTLLRGHFGMVEEAFRYKKPLAALERDLGPDAVRAALRAYIATNPREMGIQRPVTAFCKQARSLTVAVPPDSPVQTVLNTLISLSDGEVTFSVAQVDGLANLLLKYDRDDVVRAFRDVLGAAESKKDIKFVAHNFLERAQQLIESYRAERAERQKIEDEINRKLSTREGAWEDPVDKPSDDEIESIFETEGQ